MANESIKFYPLGEVWNSLDEILRKNFPNANDAKLGYWSIGTEQGLSFPFKIAENTVKGDKDLFYLDFDNSFAFIKLFKERLGNKYRDLMEDLLSMAGEDLRFCTKLKPSQFAEEILGEKVAFSARKHFKWQLNTLPVYLEQALIDEKNLRFYHYAYGNPVGSSRFHMFEATLNTEMLNHNEVKHFETNYETVIDKGLKGDALKAKIIWHIQNELEKASKGERCELWEKIQNRYDYKLLCKGQGLMTRFFNLQTSSVKALHEWVAYRFGNDLKLPVKSKPVSETIETTYDNDGDVRERKVTQYFNF